MVFKKKILGLKSALYFGQLIIEAKERENFIFQIFKMKHRIFYFVFE